MNLFIFSIYYFIILYEIYINKLIALIFAKFYQIKSNIKNKTKILILFNYKIKKHLLERFVIIIVKNMKHL
jgi:hypothetical protein